MGLFRSRLLADLRRRVVPCQETIAVTSRIAVLVVLVMVYGAGHAGGRDQCELRHQHPVLHPNFKP